MKRRFQLGLLVVAFVMLGARCGAQSSPEAPENLDELLQAGQQLWDEYAPPEVKARYEFSTREGAEQFLAALEKAFTEGSFEDIAAYEAEARQALLVLRKMDGGDELADWLEPRLDLITAAGAPGAGTPVPPAQSADVRSPLERPYWDKAIVARGAPGGAAALVPRLKEIFGEEGVPPEWVWIAEVESSMNPRARSPAGARGLFQFMPATAERFGLSTGWPDERTDAEKSARAAARYLRVLHDTFGSWPLALAAYNAGEGRVSRAMKASRADSFPTVARQLPAETRLYVPKVMATVAKREGIADPAALPKPKAR